MLKQDRRAAAKNMKMSAKEARETMIFAIEDRKIYSQNLYNFVMKSAEETTSPVGVMPKLHIRHEDYSCRYGFMNDVNNLEGLYEVWVWGISGNARFLESFETEQDAEDFIFQRTFERDFMNDDQRITTYYSTEQEAEAEIVSMLADDYSIANHVVESIFRKMKAIEAAEHLRELQVKERAQQYAYTDNIRINKIAAEYAKMITPEAGESYKQTASRLKAAIGEKIEGRVFHAAVKLIRNK